MKNLTNNPSSKEIEQVYFLWLCDLVKVGEARADRDRRELLWVLNSTEFIASVANDNNRASDGLELRDKFYKDRLDPRHHILTGPCTLLELLIALAEKMDFLICNGRDKSKVDVYFWKFIKNLGLEPYSEEDPNAENYQELNDNRITRFLSRSYLKTGKGGLFPLRKPAEDQRNIELWYQMAAYLDEHYTIY
jgi:hypothetical protein